MFPIERPFNTLQGVCFILPCIIDTSVLKCSLLMKSYCEAVKRSCDEFEAKIEAPKVEIVQSKVSTIVRSKVW